MNDKAVGQLNDFAGFLSFQKTQMFEWLMNCTEEVILLATGNQAGKTDTVAANYVARILGNHPIPTRNVVYYKCSEGHLFSPTMKPADDICPTCNGEIRRHKRISANVFRFGSETLPGQTQGDGAAEVKNMQYPAFKKRLPAFLIKKDITFRNPAMTIRNPWGGEDIITEFISYNQTTQSTAGVQRLSVWLDESPDPDLYEEQPPRLLAEDGDLILTYTFADRASWLFDMLFDRASIYYRTQTILDNYLKEDNLAYKGIETTDSSISVAVIQAATDDNPVMTAEVIDRKFGHLDPIAYRIRRYGIPKQISGKMFKTFDQRVHIIKRSKYFSDGVPFIWTQGRGIDYHPETSWACLMAAISHDDECFVWGEYNPTPDSYTTDEICTELAHKGGDYKFSVNRIDPLSKAVKKDKLSVYEDINRAFYRLKKDSIGTGGYWQTWDTKGEHGRDEIRKRLKNSIRVGTPFNNIVIENGIKKRLPTIWFLDSCPKTIESMANWRWDEWANPKDQHTKEAKNKPMEKYSHFPITLECLFKDPAFKSKRGGKFQERKYNYFQNVVRRRGGE